jgi:hypothetical protein
MRELIAKSHPAVATPRMASLRVRPIDLTKIEQVAWSRRLERQTNGIPDFCS